MKQKTCPVIQGMTIQYSLVAINCIALQHDLDLYNTWNIKKNLKKSVPFLNYTDFFRATIGIARIVLVT